MSWKDVAIINDYSFKSWRATQSLSWPNNNSDQWKISQVLNIWDVQDCCWWTAHIFGKICFAGRVLYDEVWGHGSSLSFWQFSIKIEPMAIDGHPILAKGYVHFTTVSHLFAQLKDCLIFFSFLFSFFALLSIFFFFLFSGNLLDFVYWLPLQPQI